MMRYLDVRQIACDMTFAWFLVSWFVTRHILFMIVIISMIMDTPKVIRLKWVPEEGRYLGHTSYAIFSGLLVALQVSLFLYDSM